MLFLLQPSHMPELSDMSYYYIYLLFLTVKQKQKSVFVLMCEYRHTCAMLCLGGGGIMSEDNIKTILHLLPYLRQGLLFAAS